MGAVHRVTVPSLDAATVQAVVAYREALRRRKALLDQNMTLATPVQKSAYTQALGRAMRDTREHLEDLNAILEDV